MGKLGTMKWEGMKHEWDRGSMHVGYWWEIQSERYTRRTKT
jgi:hypothetical protein